ncbi:hypothetical protein F4677DRAFT_264740 [Hypoxylon crocopeplum]|nr:hypothetical protein F4677DRAFT_264740 [Hypoxylon crocopeplum]
MENSQAARTCEGGHAVGICYNTSYRLRRRSYELGKHEKAHRRTRPPKNSRGTPESEPLLAPASFVPGIGGLLVPARFYHQPQLFGRQPLLDLPCSVIPERPLPSIDAIGSSPANHLRSYIEPATRSSLPLALSDRLTGDHSSAARRAHRLALLTGPPGPKCRPSLITLGLWSGELSMALAMQCRCSEQTADGLAVIALTRQ